MFVLQSKLHPQKVLENKDENDDSKEVSSKNTKLIHQEKSFLVCHQKQQHFDIFTAGSTGNK